MFKLAKKNIYLVYKGAFLSNIVSSVVFCECTLDPQKWGLHVLIPLASLETGEGNKWTGPEKNLQY